MLPIEQIQVQFKVPFCSFCSPQSRQITLILKAAMLNLKKLAKNAKLKISETLTSKEKGERSLGLQRLIKILFQKHQFQLKLSQSCNHFQLQNRLSHYLNCKIEELQLLLEQLCDKIARRNYELELMTVQIKNVQKSAIKLQQIAKLCPQKKQSNFNTEEAKEASKQEEKRQMEVKIEQEPNPQTGTFLSPQTGTFLSPLEGINSKTDYNSSPFQYNMYFFGPMFYQ